MSNLPKKIKFLILLLVICAENIFAQDASLNLSPVKDIERFVNNRDTIGLKKSLVKINDEFIKYQNDYVGKLLIKAANSAEKRGMPNLDLYYSLVRQYYVNKGNRFKSLEFALKQYQQVRKTGNEEGLVWILIDIGNLFYDEGENNQALDFYSKAEQIALKKNDAGELAVIYMNFGLIYKNQKAFELAIKNFRKSSFHRLRSENRRTNAATYVQMAATFIDLKNLDSARLYLNLSEKFYNDDKLGASQINEIPMYIAIERFRYFTLKGDFVEAELHFQKGQAVARKLNLDYDYNINYFIKANALRDIGQNREAIIAIKNTIGYFHQNKMISDECVVYQYLGEMYFVLNDYRNASKYFKLFSVYSYKIKISKMSVKKGMLRSIAAVYKSDLMLEKTKKIVEVQKLQNNLRIRERNISQLISLFFVLVIFVLLYLFFNSKGNRKKLVFLHQQLKSQNAEIQSNSRALERSNLIKDKLFSIIAHDLRNPLNRLMSQLAIAQKNSQNDTLLVPMEVTLKETINLFEGLLQWSRLDDKENIYNPVKTNINENIEKIIAFYNPEIQDKEIKIINRSKVFYAFADPNVLQTVLRNVMSNSIKALSTFENERIITIEISLLNDSTLEIIIIDSGHGFDQSIIDLFDKGSALNGKGLGLSLCKVLVKMSGWHMIISNHLQFSQAKVTLQLPVFVDVSIAVSAKESYEMNAASKLRLAPLKEYKVYQNSQIRLFIKSLENVEEPEVKSWIEKLEEAVRAADEKTFNELIQSLK